jgi:hypothetical protein
MPPAPSLATISNEPSLLPGARAVIGRDYTLGNPFSGTSGPHSFLDKSSLEFRHRADYLEISRPVGVVNEGKCE